FAALRLRHSPGRGIISCGSIWRNQHVTLHTFVSRGSQNHSLTVASFTDISFTVPRATFVLLSHPDAHRNVDIFSIGQRRRLSLAAVLAVPPDLLRLDEPTNHLSLVLATEIETSSQRYLSTVVIVLGDRWPRHRWRGRHHAMIFDVEH